MYTINMEEGGTEMSKKAERIEAMFTAVKEGNVGEVKALAKLLTGINLNDLEELDEYRCYETPLSVAIKQQNIEMVKVLLDNGASPRAEDADKYDTPPMHHAVMTRSVEIVEILIEFGALVDDMDFSRRTPLVLACRNGDLDMVQFLLNRGANLEHVAGNEEKPLNLRMHFDYSTREFINRRIEPWNSNTPLIEACRFRHLHVVKELIERGVDVNNAPRAGKTALLVAAYCETPEPYHFALDDSAKFNIMPTSPPILRLLIESGADVSIRNEFEETALRSVLAHISTISRYTHPTKYVAQSLQYYFMNFCLLVKSGCPLDLSYEIDLDTRPHIEDKQIVKTLHILSVAYCVINPVADKIELDEVYISAMTAAVLSGLVPGKDTVALVEERLHNSKTKDSVLSLLKMTMGEGYTLRQLCQIRVRKLIKRPLLTNVISSDFKLPVFLKSCILLDRDVPTNSWFDEPFDTKYPGYGPLERPWP